MKITSRQMHILATQPTAYMRFKTTGRLPQGETPCSPLIDVLETICPRSRMAMRDVRLHPDIGYLRGARFRNAEALLRWLKPEPVMFTSWPAESYRDKRFIGHIKIETLLKYVTHAPAVITLINGRRIRTAGQKLTDTDYEL